MTIKEFYAIIDENFNDVLSRFRKEERIERFVKMFLDDKSFIDIIDCFKAQNIEGAFRASHTLKGLAANLGFSRLAKISSDITEYLRPLKDMNCSTMINDLEKEYMKITTNIYNIK